MDVLTEIAGLYEVYRADAERTLEAQVISAFPVDEAQKQQIAAMLKKRLGREVTLSCETDKGLLGGAIIRAGDMVIDGSVTGQLAKLKVALAR
jgi:F-type H+-transporting ATPase subunit delta